MGCGKRSSQYGENENMLVLVCSKQDIKEQRRERGGGGGTRK